MNQFVSANATRWYLNVPTNAFSGAFSSSLPLKLTSQAVCPAGVVIGVQLPA